MATDKVIDQEAVNALLGRLSAHKRVYGIVTHVASSNMSRHIKLVIVTNQATIADISQLAAKVLGWKLSENGDIKVGGCGMDMVAHTISCLSYILYGDAYTLKCGSL